MRIVFMGTPEFAVPSLAALLDGGYDVAAAVTQPDRPSGRRMRLTACPVKALATSRSVPVLQFERIRRQEGLDALRALRPDLFVTAAFGQILSQKILDIPPLGTVNVHASLLPAYRGPAPINWCIIRGERTAGVTTMQTDAGIDTGDILLRREAPIGPDTTAGELTQTLAEVGARLLLDTLSRMAAGTCPRAPQDAALASHFPMLNRATGRIDWAQPAGTVHNLVRGVNPWPGAWTTLPDGGVLKIWQTRPIPDSGAPGAILWADARRGLAVACGEGAVQILEMQAPAAKRMTPAAFLLGHTIDTALPLGTEAT